MTQISGSTYPSPFGPNQPPLINLGGLTGHPDRVSPAEFVANDPSARNGAVLEMMQRWRTININIGGTNVIRYNAEEIIPREPTAEAVRRLPAQARTAYYASGYHLLLVDRQAERVWSDAEAFLRGSSAAWPPSGAPAIPTSIAAMTALDPPKPGKRKIPRRQP